MLELSASSLVIVGVIAGVAVIALVIAVVLRGQVLAADEGSVRMREIAQAIQEGARAYLNRQFRTLALFVVVVLALLFLLPGDGGIKVGRAVAFVFGAGFSAAIGYLGMWLAVRANLRVAASAQHPGGRREGARIAFRTGGVVGMSVVGLGLLGAAGVVLIFQGDAPAVLEGFGFGAALLAMFMRVGGGIFTKAADVGADLVGKVEQGIPEDDPRNAATIADNVGDNVGDCAGMAADLFESYAVTLVASLILGKAAFGEQGIIFPLIVAAIGAVVAVLGVAITRVRGTEDALTTIYRGFYISALAGVALAALAAFLYLPSTFGAITGVSEELADHAGDPRLIAAAAVTIGVVLAGVILWLTGYFTGTTSKPTLHVASTSRTGAATVVLSGIGVGFESAVYTAGIIAAAICGVFLLAGGSVWLSLFLVALAGCGLLTTVGVIVAMDTFGPVSDNAQGIAEMSGEVDEEGAQILTDLDAAGNTTKAITKGIAIATAVLAATALFGSYADAVATSLQDIVDSGKEVGGGVITSMLAYDIISPVTLVGVILGAATVFLFSGLAIDAVTRAAGAIVFEVRRQFRENPGIMTGQVRPEYGRVVDICTRDSLRELATPGLLAAFAPIAVGFGLGVGPLAGFLGGSIAAGVLMAVFLANAGGTWDNAKKLVEDGRYGGKGSEAHAAVVIGDTVGDPFKDTAGPAINPLIKVMNLVALLIAPAVVQLSVPADANHVLRIGIASAAAAVAFGAVIASRLRAAKADQENEARAEVASARAR
ncbi:K(+)-stimulated pyrophosphate-energized sodium pump [Georgenia satyanarayanai]|uniref:K(+)-insensitive pyrophosphate-energized proton pump n=1 Tax=Georgenia satyanarayanai TaxID=860221 RepID=A0A2Y9AAS1_9MICO|nr:sodium-translocating pyrophosphatase [Georgenia satyanarayanai]PYG01128.1 K(+)-stimulated pyrophosphate-energized sodium pump [Georgenia satyanarayanai]SSA39367.1 K(+)-stimulated pyrophosphate-energized sodium pump [Georgenia satyanarayanai]